MNDFVTRRFTYTILPITLICVFWFIIITMTLGTPSHGQTWNVIERYPICANGTTDINGTTIMYSYELDQTDELTYNRKVHDEFIMQVPRALLPHRKYVAGEVAVFKFNGHRLPMTIQSNINNNVVFVIVDPFKSTDFNLVFRQNSRNGMNVRISLDDKIISKVNLYDRYQKLRLLQCF